MSTVPNRRTLAIVKPDAVAAGKTGAILAHLEEGGFRVRALRFLRLGLPQAEAFYAVHAGKPFFASLTKFMSSGPVLAMALERDGAVEHLRKVIGATDPKEAAPGTIRALYAESKERNAIHASDSDATATAELRFFFADLDWVPQGLE